jgi:very-short-patch-repair endonuclease
LRGQPGQPKLAVMAGSSESIPGNREQINLTRVMRAVLELAERQWGVAAQWQLRKRGLSTSAISRWVYSGRLQRIHAGVYAVGHRVLCVEKQLLAAILYAGHGAALSHTSAAHGWELLPYLPKTVGVVSPRQRRSLPDVRVHRARRVGRVMHRGLPVTPVARTLLDLASVAPLDRVRKAVAEADFQRRIDREAINAITGVGRPGSARLKKALSRHRPEYARTLSPLEDRFLDLCRRHLIPFPEVNVVVAAYMVDALWRNEGLIVELDGGPAHGTEAQMARDLDRELALRAAGDSVLRYSWRQVTQQGAGVAADVRRALRKRA